MADATLNIAIKTDPAQPFNIVIKQMQEAEKEAGLLSTTVGKIGAAFAGLAALKGTFDFVLNATQEMEDLTTQFIAFTGSARGAELQLQRLQEFASTSPFELTQVANANRILLAFGSTTKQSIEQLRQLGEASAATGADLTELATIFGQIQAEGKLTGERFNQLVERGINIGPELAKSLGVAETSIRKLISESKISGDEVAKAFEKMTTAGGQFEGATGRLGKTVSGQLSTLKDAFTALASEVGGRGTGVFSDWIGVITEASNALTGYLAKQRELEQGGQNVQRIEEIKNQLEDLRDTLGDLEADIKRNNEGGFSSIRLNLERTEVLQQYKALNAELVSLTVDRNAQLAAEQKKADDAELAKINQKKKDKAAGLLAEQAALEQAERDKAAEAEIKKVEEKEKRITEIAFQEAAVRNAILQEQEGANDEVKILALQEREQTLTSERLRIEAERQDLLKQYDNAELLRQQDTLNKKVAAEQKAEQQRLKVIEDNKKKQFDFERIAAQQQQKFEEATAIEKLRMTQTVLEQISVLSRNKNRELAAIGKAAALFQIGIGIPDAAQKAYTSAAIFGPIAGAAAAALAVAAGIQRLNEVRTQQLGFAEGGIVPGVGNKDSVPILATPGELIVPKSNFKDVQDSLSGGGADQLVLLQQSNEIQARILDNLVFGAVADKLTQIINALERANNKLDMINIGFSSSLGDIGGSEAPQVREPLDGGRSGGGYGGGGGGGSGQGASQQSSGPRRDMERLRGPVRSGL